MTKEEQKNLHKTKMLRRRVEQRARSGTAISTLPQKQHPHTCENARRLRQLETGFIKITEAKP